MNAFQTKIVKTPSGYHVEYLDTDRAQWVALEQRETRALAESDRIAIYIEATGRLPMAWISPSDLVDLIQRHYGATVSIVDPCDPDDPSAVIVSVEIAGELREQRTHRHYCDGGRVRATIRRMVENITGHRHEA